MEARVTHLARDRANSYGRVRSFFGVSEEAVHGGRCCCRYAIKDKCESIVEYNCSRLVGTRSVSLVHRIRDDIRIGNLERRQVGGILYQCFLRTSPLSCGMKDICIDTRDR